MVKFLVIWHYLANHGHKIVEANTFDEAREKVWYDKKEIEYFVMPLEGSPVQHYKNGTEQKDVDEAIA